MRLSKARQHLKNFIHEQNITSKYICVIDLDEVIEVELVIRNLFLKQMLDKNNDKFFAISVKTTPYYYDILNYEDQNNINLDILKLQNRKDLFLF